MSYQRVIPRDLFNESSLLKCYGQIYINLEKMGLDNLLVYSDLSTTEGFGIVEDDSDGSTHIKNINLIVKGEPVIFWRPLNSRDPFPLYANHYDAENIDVFNDDGSFSQEFLALLA